MKNYKNVVAVLLLIFFSVQLFAEGDQKNKTNKLNKTNGQPEYTLFNINNISTFVKNDGESDINLNGNSGFLYPKESNKAVFFQSGFLYGGKIEGEIRVGGSTYNQGQVPGRIISEGIAESPELPHVRIYRVRRDYKTADLSGEIIFKRDTLNNGPTYAQNVSASEAFKQYEKDWEEWPALYGAPFEDINKNGTYEASIDIPGVPGADQTIWFVCNDLNEAVSKKLYGSTPLGIEMQATFWGYKKNNILENVLFRKYVLINKSGKPITDMYISMWSDPDVGDATDDYVGIDTTLSLTYAYNGDDYDATYGEQVPAVGFKLLQGPLVEGTSNDTAKTNGQIFYGKKNLKYTAFSYFVASDPMFSDPNLGEYIEGTLEIYKLMQGLIGTSGNPFINPSNGYPTKFTLSGDPIKKKGWIDGLLHQPGDRRMIASSGPFEMAAYDTQEIIIAQIAAVGENRFESIKLLRFFSSQVDSEINNINDFSVPQIIGVYNGINDNISFEWDNDSENKNYEGYQFQGYKIVQLHEGELVNRELGTEIASFDKADGIKEIEGIVMDSVSGFPIKGIIFNGNDSGIKNRIEIEKDYLSNSHFVIGKKYYFTVSAIYYNSIVGESLTTTSSVYATVYKNSYSGPKFRDTLAVQKINGIGTADINVVIDDPQKITGHKYKIWFSNLNDTLNWNLRDITEGTEILLNQKIIQRPTDMSFWKWLYDTEPEYVITEGLKITVSGKSTPFSNFEVVANSSGILIPSEGGAYPKAGFPSKLPTDRQQIGPAIWLFNARSMGIYINPYYTFLNYILGGNYSFNKIVPYDWEMRFTNEGSYALHLNNQPKIMKVPFELWRTGINTPDDPNDDVRLIPEIFESIPDNIFNLESWGMNFEHSVSEGDDDPYTDRIYWAIPADDSPGSAGYDNFVNSLDLVNNTTGPYTYSGDIIFHRTVLVNLNGGSKPPFNQELPETGTIFRITTVKNIEPGIDEYEFSTTSIEKHLQNIASTNKFSLSQNFPNPFNSTTRIKYKIPLENIFGVKNIYVKLIVYDILGREVTKLVNGEQPPGDYEVLFNTSNLASGVYIYLIQAGDFREIKKMVLLK